MEEKTIEEMEAELKALTKENLARQLEAEKEKALEAQREAEAKKVEEMKEQMRNDIMEELAEESHIVKEGKPQNMVSDKSDFQMFLSKWRENKGLSGRRYEDLIKDVCNKGGY